MAVLHLLAHGWLWTMALGSALLLQAAPWRTVQVRKTPSWPRSWTNFILL
jgi:hypothetical protein